MEIFFSFIALAFGSCNIKETKRTRKIFLILHSASYDNQYNLLPVPCIITRIKCNNKMASCDKRTTALKEQTIDGENYNHFINSSTSLLMCISCSFLLTRPTHHQ